MWKRLLDALKETTDELNDMGDRLERLSDRVPDRLENTLSSLEGSMSRLEDVMGDAATRRAAVVSGSAPADMGLIAADFTPSNPRTGDPLTDPSNVDRARDTPMERCVYVPVTSWAAEAAPRVLADLREGLGLSLRADAEEAADPLLRRRGGIRQDLEAASSRTERGRLLRELHRNTTALVDRRAQSLKVKTEAGDDKDVEIVDVDSVTAGLATTRLSYEVSPSLTDQMSRVDVQGREPMDQIPAAQGAADSGAPSSSAGAEADESPLPAEMSAETSSAPVMALVSLPPPSSTSLEASPILPLDSGLDSRETLDATGGDFVPDDLVVPEEKDVPPDAETQEPGEDGAARGLTQAQEEQLLASTGEESAGEDEEL